MRDSLTIALAQMNPLVGDVHGNAALVRRARALAAEGGADAVVFSELFLSGYPPEDLVLKPVFQEAVAAAAQQLARATADGGPALLLGAPWAEEGRLYNAVLLLDGGGIQGLCRKRCLPGYGVFDEPRVFAPGASSAPLELRGVPVGVPICEDIWTPDVTAALAEAGAQMLLVPNGSPFDHGKFGVRVSQARARALACALPLAYVNQVGGQDELVFDGGSFVLNPDGALALRLPAWEEAVTLSRWSRTRDGWRCAPGVCAPMADGLEAIYMAICLGLRDYVDKNGFPGVVLGLSGGVDSALCAALAVDALGADRVRCIMLPSQHTSAQSLDDARACASALGVALDTIAITGPVGAVGEALAGAFAGRTPDVTEENIQSRMRGLLLMALSNKFGLMLVTTGNKSEISVGYATLYGDMNGGYNPLKDVYKMQVFALAAWRNGHRPPGLAGPEGEVIAASILDKPPSAELRQGQRDSDSLPPYEVLDAILARLVEQEMSAARTAALGHDPGVVQRVAGLLRAAEYKRRQAAPGPMISLRNFGRGRRYPLTNAFQDKP